MDLIERRAKALGPSYSLFYEHPVHLTRGQGICLWDANVLKIRPPMIFTQENADQLLMALDKCFHSILTNQLP